MKIYSAPLQGFTEAVWRNVHAAIFGGIDGYYTPFLRYEHGEIRNKDIRDVERKNNTAQNLVAAAEGEHGEWTDMYARMAREAEEEGITVSGGYKG